jgi:hypothetical protein
VRDIFIPTANYQKLVSMITELLSRWLGLEMATLVARAGSGKTTALKRLAAMNPLVVLVSFAGWLTGGALLREICFGVAGARPRATQACFELLERTLADQRRVIVVDESDRMSLRHLNLLRDLHDRLCVPIVLAGEEPLRGKLAQERRLISRISHELVFQPVGPADLILFYQRNLELEISPKIAGDLARHSQGDFRSVVKDGLRIERLMKANGLSEVTEDLVREICR